MNQSETGLSTSARLSPVWWGWREAAGLVVAAHLALLFVGAVVIVIGGWETPYPVSAQFFATAPFWVVAIAGAWRLAGSGSGNSGSGPSDPKAALGLAISPIDVPVGIVVGIVTQWIIIPVVYWPLLKVLGSSTDEVEKAAREFVDSATGFVGVSLLVIMTCIAAPIAEEVLYRAVLLRGASRTNVVVGVVVSSVVFGALHLQALQFVGLTIFGAMASLLVVRSNRLGPAVVAHMAFNASTVVPLLMRR